MSLDVGSNSIGSIYYGNNEIVEVYHGNDLVWVAYSDAPNYIFRDIDSNGKLTLATGNLESASGIKRVLENGLSYIFTNCTGLTGSVNFPSLTSLTKNYSFYNAFNGCSNITSVSFPKLNKIGGQYVMYRSFLNCTSLTSVSFPELTEFSSGNIFSGYTFKNCTSLTSISFPKLKSVLGQYALGFWFQDCTSLTSLSFPALTNDSFGNAKNQFYYMLSGVNGCTVHFPSNIQEKVSSLTSYQQNFGGTNTILFDLPATS